MLPSNGSTSNRFTPPSPHRPRDLHRLHAHRADAGEQGDHALLVVGEAVGVELLRHRELGVSPKGNVRNTYTLPACPQPKLNSPKFAPSAPTSRLWCPRAVLIPIQVFEVTNRYQGSQGLKRLL